jgi:ADP-dependent NAD(P)H-hydrate dehydratase
MPRPKLPALPPRPNDGHKGTFGRVLVVGGSAAMAGAPILCGRAALRMGSGLVQLAVGNLAHAASIAACPELIGLPGAPELGAIRDATKNADAIAVGPGWGTSPSNRRILLALLKLDTTLVIDADALNLLAKEKRWPARKGTTILTPHPGEMKRLAENYKLGTFDAANDEQRAAVATKLAKLTGGVVVLKGSRTVIAESQRLRINTTGDSSLSKAGTGDVLTGIIASLVGQGMTPFDAATLGTHVHGLAGELAGKRLGQRSVLASDVIEALAETIRQIERSRKR